LLTGSCSLDGLISAICKSFGFKPRKDGHNTKRFPLHEHLENAYSDTNIQEAVFGKVGKPTLVPFKFRMLLFTMAGLCSGFQKNYAFNYSEVIASSLEWKSSRQIRKPYHLLTLESYLTLCPRGPEIRSESENAMIEAPFSAALNGNHASKTHPLWDHVESSYNTKTLQEILFGTNDLPKTFSPKTKMFLCGMVVLLSCLPKGYTGNIFSVVANAF
jgi:hypothetical protein